MKDEMFLSYIEESYIILQLKGCGHLEKTNIDKFANGFKTFNEAKNAIKKEFKNEAAICSFIILPQIRVDYKTKC
jgi:hypothetical protein